jgi:hypothetical protein
VRADWVLRKEEGGKIQWIKDMMFWKALRLKKNCAKPKVIRTLPLLMVFAIDVGDRYIHPLRRMALQAESPSKKPLRNLLPVVPIAIIHIANKEEC